MINQQVDLAFSLLDYKIDELNITINLMLVLDKKFDKLTDVLTIKEFTTIYAILMSYSANLQYEIQKEIEYIDYRFKEVVLN